MGMGSSKLPNPLCDTRNAGVSTPVLATIPSVFFVVRLTASLGPWDGRWKTTTTKTPKPCGPSCGPTSSTKFCSDIQQPTAVPAFPATRLYYLLVFIAHHLVLFRESVPTLPKVLWLLLFMIYHYRTTALPSTLSSVTYLLLVHTSTHHLSRG